ncbi:MAG: metallophosphoesterase family protein [Anaerolineae bacterium]|nr:metallophosphatase family protein [Anaerolineae bacterium]MDW8067705.1 metallophosphoesterase family protein [Anaerolineae bacterium]
MTRLAILSDTHGNLPALEAVLADIERQGQPDFYWVLGDLVAFFPWPRETLDRLRSLPNVSFLQGNTDRYLVTGRRPLAPVRSPEDWARMPGFLEMRDGLFRWTVERLTWEDYLFLRDLPTRLAMDFPGYGRVMAVHAVPGDDETNILPDTPDEQILPHLSGLDARLLAYGHTHRPLDRQVGGVRLVNGGSVGLSLDGDPRAGYALLDFHGPECTVTLRRVAYDGERVVAELERVGHPARSWLTSMLRRAAP